MTIKVLIVDDSAVVRDVLSELLGSDPGIEVVGTAVDPIDAREKIKQCNPDVLTLDVEMPRMDGLTFLKNLMRLRPMPVVMISSLTTEAADTTLEALDIGAVDFIAKPQLGAGEGEIALFSQNVIYKVKTAAATRRQLVSKQVGKAADTGKKQLVLEKPDHRKVVAIGASTGGTEALRDVLGRFPANMPGVVVTQHIPASFSERFAKRLDETCAMKVVEASDGELIKPGVIYVAPGDVHLRVIRQGAAYCCRLDDGPLVNRHKPAVDVMYNSLLELKPEHVTAALLTGMGSDGAEGMLGLKQQGSYTIAQDEASSLVWGMPGSAVKMGAACDILPLDQVAAAIVNSVSR